MTTTPTTPTAQQCRAELPARGLLPAGRSAVYMAGSLVRGWGNATSDLDVYVIVHEPWDGETTTTSPVSVPPGSVPVAVFHDDGGRRWDVEYWLDGQVDALLDAVSLEAFESGRGDAGTLTDNDIAFAQRIPFSLVVEGEEWMRRRREQFGASAIHTMIAAEALYRYDLFSEDAVGMLGNDDLDSAVLAAHLAFGRAVEALLASLGEFNEQPKWRARRVREVAPAVLPFDKYWEIETMRTLDHTDPRPWVQRVLRTCQDIVTEVKL